MSAPDIDRISPTRRPDERPVMYQSWRHLLFLHWALPPEVVAPLLPPGLSLDTFEGRAWVGLVPFTMRGVRPRGLPAVGFLSDFHETNVSIGRIEGLLRGGGLERRGRGGPLTGAARAVLQGGAQAAQPLGDTPALADPTSTGQLRAGRVALPGVDSDQECQVEVRTPATHKLAKESTRQVSRAPEMLADEEPRALCGVGGMEVGQQLDGPCRSRSARPRVWS